MQVLMFVFISCRADYCKALLSGPHKKSTTVMLSHCQCADKDQRIP